jgi:hypothetical protein
MKYFWVYMKQKFKVSQWIIFGILLHETISKVSNEILFGVLLVLVIVLLLLHETIFKVAMEYFGVWMKQINFEVSMRYLSVNVKTISKVAMNFFLGSTWKNFKVVMI